MSKFKEQKRWLSPVPPACQHCGGSFKECDGSEEFVDAKMRAGRWGIICNTCHMHYGVGLGIGRGQRYRKGKNGQWYKVEG